MSLADRAPARSARPRPAHHPGRAVDPRKWYEIIGLTAPAAIVFAVFVLAPMGFAVYYSLYKWSGYGWPTEFRGLDNYFGPYGAFRDPIFRDALRNNAIILVGSLLIQGPRRARDRAAAQPHVPRPCRVPHAGLRPVRAVRGHRRHHVGS